MLLILTCSSERQAFDLLGNMTMWWNTSVVLDSTVSRGGGTSPEILSGAGVPAVERDTVGSKIVLEVNSLIVAPVDSNHDDEGTSGGCFFNLGLVRGDSTDVWVVSAVVGAGCLLAKGVLVNSDEVLVGESCHLIWAESGNVGGDHEWSLGDGPESELGSFFIGGEKATAYEEVVWVVEMLWSSAHVWDQVVLEVVLERLPDIGWLSSVVVDSWRCSPRVGNCWSPASNILISPVIKSIKHIDINWMVGHILCIIKSFGHSSISILSWDTFSVTTSISKEINTPLP